MVYIEANLPIISAENVSAAGGPEQDNNRQAGEWTIDMNITDIKIRKLLNEGRLKAIVSITLDDTIAPVSYTHLDVYKRQRNSERFGLGRLPGGTGILRKRCRKPNQ